MLPKLKSHDRRNRVFILHSSFCTLHWFRGRHGYGNVIDAEIDMNNEFRKGDIVRLKSGGPAMTVKKATENGELWCDWFDKEDKPQIRSFNPESLEYPGSSGSSYAVG